MPSRSTSKIVLAGALVIITMVPAFARGGSSSASHSSSSVGARAATATRSNCSKGRPLAPAARSARTTSLAAMPSTSLPGAAVPTATTTVPDDPPAASTTALGTMIVTTSPSTMSGGSGALRGGGLPPDLSQFNLRAQDLATSAVSAPRTTDITNTTLLSTGSQILGVNGLVLPNAATSGAVAQAPTTAAIIGTQGEVIATSGGTAITGASGGACRPAWRLGRRART